MKCSFEIKMGSTSTSEPLWHWVLCFFLCVSVDVPCSLVLCLLLQGFIWQLHEEHNYTTRKAIWHPQLSDRRHRWELWNRWLSDSPLFSCLYIFPGCSHTFWRFKVVKQAKPRIRPEHVIRVDAAACICSSLFSFECCLVAYLIDSLMSEKPFEATLCREREREGFL